MKGEPSITRSSSDYRVGRRWTILAQQQRVTPRLPGFFHNEQYNLIRVAIGQLWLRLK